MSDDELYLACLLAIGPWDFTVPQVQFLCDQNRQALGRAPTLEENMAFVQGYRKYCAGMNVPKHNETIAGFITALMIDTHTVGR